MGPTEIAITLVMGGVIALIIVAVTKRLKEKKASGSRGKGPKISPTNKK